MKTRLDVSRERIIYVPEIDPPVVVERSSFKGRVRLEVYEDGQLVRDVWGDNLIPDDGKNAMRDLIGGFSKFPAAIALGTSDVTPVAGDIQLGNEVVRKEIIRRTRPRDRAVRMQAFLGLTEANGNTLKEAGLFNSTAANVGEMFSRFTYDDITKTSSIEVTITWEWEVQ